MNLSHGAMNDSKAEFFEFTVRLRALEFQVVTKFWKREMCQPQFTRTVLSKSSCGSRSRTYKKKKENSFQKTYYSFDSTAWPAHQWWTSPNLLRRKSKCLFRVPTAMCFGVSFVTAILSTTPCTNYWHMFFYSSLILINFIIPNGVDDSLNESVIIDVRPNVFFS